jgi:anti-sigma28 factor (negative regulator of flagellin synthesis)
MATSKKSSKKSSKASTKKSSKKKAAATAKQKLEFTLNPERVAAIQRCLEKGTLRVTVSRADLSKGRIRDPWLYD